jgi:excisionase family DNA binding protein
LSTSTADTCLTAQQIAGRLNCDVATVYRWEKEGKIPAAIRFGRAYRWDAASFENWLLSRQEAHHAAR